MSLLDEIRSDLVNESANLSNTLRKAKILASELGVPEFREWVDFELDGYPNREKVPSYRRIRPTNVGTFVGPFQKVDNVPLPTYNLPVAVRDFAENLFFFVGVGELEAQVSSSSDSFQKKWAPEMVMLAKPHISTYKPFLPRGLQSGTPNIAEKPVHTILCVRTASGVGELEGPAKKTDHSLSSPVHMVADDRTPLAFFQMKWAQTEGDLVMLAEADWRSTHFNDRGSRSS